MELGGLHHVTAVTGNAPGNVAFYTNVLGLRMIKKTVNQDDVSAYHLFYGDNIGHAGTEVTFFDWPTIGKNVAGTGEISEIGLRVPDQAALEYWVQRFDEAGVKHGDSGERNGRPALPFKDPEGQRLALVVAESDLEFTPWGNSPVPAEMQIRGLNHVTLVIARLASTERVLTDLLGFKRAGEYAAPGQSENPIVVFETGPGGPGAEVHISERPELSPSQLGAGGVHHIAFRTPGDDEHKQWQERLASAGVGVTPVIDRYYFRSIYFREPGRVLYEIATDGPGFTTDEDAETLGERLALPPFLEPRRAEIEAGLTPID